MADQHPQASIEYRILIDSQPECVYTTLTTAAGWDSWLTDRTILNLHPGGIIHFRWGSEQTDAPQETLGIVVEAITNDRFCFTWQPQNLDHSTLVSFTIEAAEGRTLLIFIEEGYSDSDADLEALAQASETWGKALLLLKMALEE